MKCEECKVNYPEEILSPSNINGKFTGLICGICALEISNEFHGTNRKKFHGEIAEGFRLEAINHRKLTGQLPHDEILGRK